jgi:hypothetical protein
MIMRDNVNVTVNCNTSLTNSDEENKARFFISISVIFFTRIAVNGNALQTNHHK